MHAFAQVDSLPSSLFSNVLRDWLNLKSVMALNSAYCQKSRRGKLLCLLQSKEYFIREKVEIGSNSSAIWDVVQLFGEKIRFLAVEEALSDSQEKLVALHCHNLTRVHFEGIGSCTEELLRLLSTNPNLERVTLSTPCIYYSSPPSGFLSFSDIQSSKFLSFAQGWNPTDEDRIEVLHMNKYITRLELSHESVRHSVLQQIPTLCPHLTHLGLRNTKLTDDVLSELVVGCPHIAHLDIGSNELITDAGVLAVVQNLRGLQSLNIVGNSKLTDASLRYMHTYCARTLHTLHFSDTTHRQAGAQEAQEEDEEEEVDEGDEGDDQVSQYSTSAVNILLERCTQLRELRFQFHKSVVFTPAAVRNLTTLVLDGGIVCRRNLAIISQYAVHLHTLWVGEITTYSRESLLNLVHGCPRLQNFYFCFEDIDMHNIDDYDRNTRQFALAFMDLWRTLRPGLVAETSSVRQFYFKIME